MPAKIYQSGKLRKLRKLLDVLNRVPPWKCRAMAVRKVRSGSRNKPKDTVRIPVQELVKLSGIPRRSLSKLAYQRSWVGIPVDVASQFAYACGVDVLAENPEAEFVEKNFKPGLPYFNKRQRRAFDRAANGIKA